MWRNDWSTLTVPPIGGWTPTRAVTVVVPAYNCQPSLDLTLAALTRQTYPASLLEVVVVDDGSTPPIALPALRPANCRQLTTGEGWGRAAALDWGARHSDGEIIHWLDADMVPFEEHVEAQVRWHEAIDYAVTLGYKRMVDTGPDTRTWPTVKQVATGALAELFPPALTDRHEYVEAMIERYDELRRADHDGFLVHVGATATLRRSLYLGSGGLNPALRLGEDTELGYRLAQAGAAFIPEPAARSWHLGRTHAMKQADQVRRYNKPYLADLMAHPRWLRKGGGTAWSVPLVTVVVPAAGPLERVRAAVDSVLASDMTDLRVLLVGPWADVATDERRSVLRDPLLDLRLISATYQGEPRVRLVEQAPASVFPSPFLLTLPAGVGLAPEAVGSLLAAADQTQAGLVRVPRAGAGAGPDDSIDLWRTAALSRAALEAPEPSTAADHGETVTPGARPWPAGHDRRGVAGVWGEISVAGEVVGVVELASFSVGQLSAGVGAVRGGAYRPGKWVASSVEVAGVRSLGVAGVVVARVASRKAWARVRRVVKGTG